MVPALRAFTDLEIRSAVATSLLCLTLISTGTVVILFLQGHADSVPHALPFVAGAVVGVGAGRLLTRRLPQVWQQRGFAVLLLPVAMLLIFQGLSIAFR